jgi:hypothetical protein
MVLEVGLEAERTVESLEVLELQTAWFLTLEIQEVADLELLETVVENNNSQELFHDRYRMHSSV